MNSVKDQEAGRSATTSQKDTETGRMENPPIHITRYGTQYVNVIDIIRSEVGWSEIKRLREAHLVKEDTCNQNGNTSSQQKDKAS